MDPELAFLAPSIYVLIELLKPSPLPSWSYPIAAVVLGCVLALGYSYVNGVTDGPALFDAGIIGALLGASAVGINQTAKQLEARNEPEPKARTTK